MTKVLVAIMMIVSTVSNSMADESDILRVPVDALSGDSAIEVVIFMQRDKNKSITDFISPIVKATRGERIKFVLNKLNNEVVPGQRIVESFLHQYSNNLTKHKIVPAYTVSLKPSRLRELASLPGIKRIITNSALELVAPTEVELSTGNANGVSAGLSQMNVPSLWKRGLTGKGRLVCSFDTGVERSHPALASKWRGNKSSLRSSWFSTINPDSIPYDRVNHGTHTMGVIVGSEDGDTVGVAPGAEWITAGIIDQGRNLNNTISDILLAFEWVLNPDGDISTTDDVPDVILNSWGVPAGLFDPCDDTFWEVIDVVEAAGIVTIFAAGNEGPDPKTIRNPADRPTGPTNSFSVGAVGGDNLIADFSSRGPSTCNPGRVKPEIVGPGVQIRSSVKGGGYGTMSGSSMAAPFVAGLVALCRQYNPDATVEEIKTAFLLAAEDLGPIGPDNAYGHGLINASRIIEFLPIPSDAVFSVARSIISDDGVALPGESFDLTVLLSNAAANTPLVYGRLVAIDPSSAVVSEDRVTFLFGVGGTVALGQSQFTITTNSSIFHGELLPFEMILESPDSSQVGKINVNVQIGYTPPGQIAKHNEGRLQFTVSDFGQFGFSAGTGYNLGGDGFTFDGGKNLLYEAGIIVARNELQFSSTVRSSHGKFVPSDFKPSTQLVESINYRYGGKIISSRYTDTGSEIPLPITITQQTIDYADLVGSSIIIIRFSLVNTSLERLTNVSFGFFADFDMGSSEQIHFSEPDKMIYQSSDNEELVAIVGLKNVASFTSLSNPGGNQKSGLSKNEWVRIISNSEDSLETIAGEDLMFVVSSGPFILSPGDSVEIALALIAANSEQELFSSAEIAQQRFGIITSLEENRDLLPDEFTLSQNYPNPFNPSTNIAFTLETGADITLEIFNLLGQTVISRQYGKYPVGQHLLTWDGKINNNEEAASGIYFYRVTAGNLSQTKKMLLVR